MPEVFDPVSWTRFLDHKLWRQGHDAQLEKAVQVVMDLLNKNETHPHKRPPFPNYHTTSK